MSQSQSAALFLILLSACGGGGQAGGSDAAGPPKPSISWASQDLTEGVDESLTGPGGKLRLAYAGDRARVTNSDGGSLIIGLLPPASIVWRPDGGAVAINNGNGSGQMSDLSVVLNGHTPTLLKGVQEDITRYFIAETKCLTDYKNISVDAEGWSFDNSTLWVNVEYWNRENFCDPDISFVEYNLSARKVVSHLSRDEVLAKFCPDPGFRSPYDPNCAARGY
jgi:hypothetical protein